MVSCAIDTLEDGDNLLVRIKGYIGEECPLFHNNIKAFKTVTIDFSETTFINSLGIRHWIEWVNGPKVSTSAKFLLVHCVPSIVTQFNMIKGFLTHKCVVESLYVEYFVENTGESKRVLLKRGVDYEAQKDQQEGWVKIKEEFSQDGVQFTLDTIKEKYFAFLGKVKFEFK